MRRLAILALPLVLTGCLALSFGGRTVTQAPAPPPPPRDTSPVSDVWGYGMGPTEAEASKAAWSDAIARMKDMGFADGQHTIKATPEVKHVDTTQAFTASQAFKASVHLEISR